MTFLAWYCRRCGRILKTEPEGVYPRGCSCRVPVLPTGPTSVTASARLYLHPALLARRAGEIAQSQGGRIRQDACGRPFVARAEPFRDEPPVEPEPVRFAWLILYLPKGSTSLYSRFIKFLAWKTPPSMAHRRTR